MRKCVVRLLFGIAAGVAVASRGQVAAPPAPAASQPQAAIAAGKRLNALADRLQSAGKDLRVLPYLHAKELLRQGRAAEALPPIEAYYQGHKDDADVAYNYGVALLLAGNPKGALPVLKRAARRDPTLAPAVLYYTGLAQIRLREFRAAAQSLQDMVRAAPAHALAPSARLILAEMMALNPERIDEFGLRRRPGAVAALGPVGPGKRWSLSLSAGGEYDSNVALIPDGIPAMPDDISNRHDLRAVVDLAGRYLCYQDGDRELSLSAGYFQTRHHELTDYDLDALSLQGTWQLRLSPDWQVRASLRHGEMWLGSQHYNWSWQFVPGVTYRETPTAWIDLDYAAGLQFYEATPVLAEEDRDAQSHEVRVRQSVFFRRLLPCGPTTVSVTLSFGASSADGSAYDNDVMGGWGQVQQVLPWDTTLTAGYGYRYVDYWHPSPRWPDDDKRVDHEQTFSLELTKRLSANLSLYAAYRYFDNESTLDTLFSYSSTTYSLGLRADF